MIYREYSPSARLTPYIECYWILQSEVSAQPPAPERILPDGCMEIVLNFAAPFCQHNPGGATVLQPRFFVVGEMHHAMLVAPSGAVDIAGVRFKPGGAYPLLRVPIDQMTAQPTTELDLVAHQLYKEVEGPIASARDIAARLLHLDKALCNMLPAGADDGSIVRAAVTAIMAVDGQISIDTLTESLGIGRRLLERRFKPTVGTTPKVFARIIRFQKIFSAFEADDASGLTALAFDCGYYDQAHFIREFKDFAGVNPSTYFAQQYQLAQHFLRKNRLLQD